MPAYKRCCGGLLRFSGTVLQLGKRAAHEPSSFNDRILNTGTNSRGELSVATNGNAGRFTGVNCPDRCVFA